MDFTVTRAKGGAYDLKMVDSPNVIYCLRTYNSYIRTRIATADRVRSGDWDRFPGLNSAIENANSVAIDDDSGTITMETPYGVLEWRFDPNKSIDYKGNKKYYTDLINNRSSAERTRCCYAVFIDVAAPRNGEHIEITGFEIY